MAIRKLPFVNTIKRVHTYQEVLEVSKLYIPDIIIADLRLVLKDDFQALNSYTFKDVVPVIYIIEEPEDAVLSYTIGVASDCLMRPFSNERLMIAVNRALKDKLNISFNGMTGLDFLFLKMVILYKKFMLEDIQYIEAYGIYVKIHTENGVFIVNEIISKL